MIVALILVGYALLLATVGAGLLERVAWPERAPRLGILVWQALTVSVVAAAVLGGLALTISTVPVSASMAAWLRACVMALQAQYATPGGALAGAGGAIVALAVLARVGWCLALTLRTARRSRSRQREALAILGRTEHGLGGVTVVDSAHPLAYCLPGRGHRVVLSSAALAALTDEQVHAVLAHERAHLRERHDLANAAAGALARAFPRVPGFRAGARQIARLAEMSADDAATQSADRLEVADAMLTLAAGHAPAAALGAGGDGVAERVRRLIADASPLGRLRWWATAGVSAALLLVPVMVALAPAIVARRLDYCPLPPVSQAAALAQHVGNTPPTL